MKKTIILFHTDKHVHYVRLSINGVIHDSHDIRANQHIDTKLTIVTSKNTISGKDNINTQCIEDANYESTEMEVDLVFEDSEIYTYSGLESKAFKDLKF